MQMTFTDDDLDRLSDRLAEHIRDKLPDWRPLVSDPEDGEILGIDPHRLYSAQALAERWDISADTVYRIGDNQLPRADWQGSGVRYRGVDILHYEGITLNSEHSSPDEETGQKAARAESDRAPQPGRTSGDVDDTESNCSGKLPKL